MRAEWPRVAFNLGVIMLNQPHLNKNHPFFSGINIPRETGWILRVNYQMRIIEAVQPVFQRQHQLSEMFHLSPSGDKFSVGCRCLETEGIRSNTHRYFFWITFHSYSVNFLSNEVTLKLESKIHCHEKLISYTLL